MTLPDTHKLTTPAGRKTRKGAFAGAAVVVACAVACSLPLIAAGGLAAGVGAFLAGSEAVALGVVLLVAAVVSGAIWWRRRRAAAAAADGCGCGGGC